MRDQNSPSPSEQYVDWGKNINYISMRDQNSPPPMNNMLGGWGKSHQLYLHEGSKFATPLWTICWLGEKHQLYPHEGSKFATPSEQYVDWGKNINYISMRGQNSPPPLGTICWLGEKHQLYLHEGSKLATPMNNMLIGAIASTLSSLPPEVRHGAALGLQRTSFIFAYFNIPFFWQDEWMNMVDRGGFPIAEFDAECSVALCSFAVGSGSVGYFGHEKQSITRKNCFVREACIFQLSETQTSKFPGFCGRGERNFQVFPCFLSRFSQSKAL